MFPKRYFVAKMFAPRYFPPVLEDNDEEISAGGRRVFGESFAAARIQSHDYSNPNVTIGGMAKGKVKH